MDYSNYAILLEANPVIVGGQSGTTEATAGTAVTPEAVPPGEQQAGISSFLPMILMVVVFYIAMYFIVMRPQRKRDKEMKTMQSSITRGDNIVTTTGLFGRIIDVGEDVFVVEFGTNRGVRIPVLKSEIAAIRVPKMTPPPAAPKEKE